MKICIIPCIQLQYAENFNVKYDAARKTATVNGSFIGMYVIIILHSKTGRMIEGGKCMKELIS